MTVSNPHHLSEGRRMLVHTVAGAMMRGTLLHNDVAQQVLRLEVDEGAYEVIAYSDFRSARVLLNS